MVRLLHFVRNDEMTLPKHLPKKLFHFSYGHNFDSCFFRNALLEVIAYGRAVRNSFNNKRI